MVRVRIDIFEMETNLTKSNDFPNRYEGKPVNRNNKSRKYARAPSPLETN